MSTALLVVGDALLDSDLSGRVDRLAPDAPVPVVSAARQTLRPGGAALAAYLAACDGREVTLVTALGDDEASGTLRDLLAGRVRLVELPLTGGLSRKTRVLSGEHPLLRLDEGDGRAAGPTDEAVAAVAAARAVLVSDYGRGAADTLRPVLAEAAWHHPVVWDPHPRGGPPVRGTRLVTPSAAEATAFARARTDGAGGPAGEERAGRPVPAGLGGLSGAEEPYGRGPHPAEKDRAPADRASAGSPGVRPAGGAAAADARALVHRWQVASVAVTLGERGALLSHGAEPLLVPAPWRAQGDACGAGDRFAASAAGLLADGALPEAAVQGAVRAATCYVADGGARALRIAPAPAAARPPGSLVGTPAATGPRAAASPHVPETAVELAGRVRARGGTVVAAGGCFDLLHAGHIALLQAARQAGDCLIVCVNSDDSVRRRKGEGRPLVPAPDRVRVLRALECVDAVAVFDEDTPERLLADLRPDVWAKGADYARTDLPEAALLRSWGGEVVLLPYLDGRSTTTLAARAALRPAAEHRP